MFGKIKLQPFKGLNSMPQKAASAWNAFESSGVCGASYTPLYYAAEQEVKGTNHWFIAGQTLQTATADRNIVTVAINEFNGAYAVIPTSINEVEFKM